MRSVLWSRNVQVTFVEKPKLKTVFKNINIDIEFIFNQKNKPVKGTAVVNHLYMNCYLK